MVFSRMFAMLSARHALNVTPENIESALRPSINCAMFFGTGPRVAGGGSSPARRSSPGWYELASSRVPCSRKNLFQQLNNNRQNSSLKTQNFRYVERKGGPLSIML